MTQPVFTIGIPTYNRARLLRESLGTALAQTAEDIEVFVSDNASTDDTPELVRGFGAAVRYRRNPQNLGPARNFASLAEEARGAYFSWLQDDDGLEAEFARRAIAAFRDHPEVMVYMTYAAYGPSFRSFHFTRLNGPPFDLDWCRGTPRVLDGRLVAPLSLLMSVAIPPTLAFRTDVLRQHLGAWQDEGLRFPLFVERTLLAAIAARGQVLVDPRIGGFFRDHAEQGWKRMEAEREGERRRQWLLMVEALEALMRGWDDGWKAELRAVFDACPEDYRLLWWGDAQTWPEERPLCRAVREILRASLRTPLAPSPTPLASAARTVKGALRELTPPLVWRLGGRSYRALRSRR